jgi:hypothetical protein
MLLPIVAMAQITIRTGMTRFVWLLTNNKAIDEMTVPLSVPGLTNPNAVRVEALNEGREGRLREDHMSGTTP